MDVVYYIVALVAHATKTHDVKDLGFYNVGVVRSGPGQPTSARCLEAIKKR